MHAKLKRKKRQTEMTREGKKTKSQIIFQKSNREDQIKPTCSNYTLIQNINSLEDTSTVRPKE